MTIICVVAGIVGAISTKSLNQKALEEFKRIKIKLLQILTIDLWENVNLIAANGSFSELGTIKEGIIFLINIVCKDYAKTKDVREKSVTIMQNLGAIERHCQERRVVPQDNTSATSRPSKSITNSNDAVIKYTQRSTAAIQKFCEEYYNSEAERQHDWTCCCMVAAFILFLLITITILLLDGGMIYNACFSYISATGCCKS